MAAGERSAGFCPLGQWLYRLQGAGKALGFVFFPQKPNLSHKQANPTLPLSLLFVCEVYQYSVGFLSALILLDFVICLKRGVGYYCQINETQVKKEHVFGVLSLNHLLPFP